MKYVASLLMVGVVLCAIGVAEEEDQWFDLHGCDICKNLAAEDGMMEAMTWENHIIDNGMLTISIVPEAYKESMERAKKGMHSTIKKLESGESAKLCNFCQSYGALMHAGVKSQEIKTAGGDVHLMTSDDPTVVKQIHAHAKKTIAAHKAMMHGHSQGDADHHKKSASTK